MMECADITFIISGQEIEEIIFRGDPVYAIYPMNLIPEAQPQRLPNFVWEATADLRSGRCSTVG